MGGGVIPTAIQIFFGYPLLVYLVVALAIKHRTGKARWLPVMVPLILVYVALGFAMTYAPEGNEGVVHLYVVLLLVIAGTAWLVLNKPAARIAAFTATVLFVVVLNFYHPKLVDFQNRVYFDNESDLNPVSVSYPNYWRELHLEDGRILINVNRQRRVGGTVRLIANANRIKSPISLIEAASNGNGVIFDVHTPLITSGTWGWQRRPEAVFHAPLAGTANILKFENRYAGKALLLDEDGRVDCRYLYEARDEPVPDAARGRHVVWTVQRVLEVPSVVECSE